MHEQTAFLHWIAFLLGGCTFIVVGWTLAKLLRSKPSASSRTTYESGEPSTGAAARSFPVHFYAMGLVFVLFEVETLCLLPWAATWHRAPCGLVWAAGLGLGFLLILTLGLICVRNHMRLSMLPTAAPPVSHTVVSSTLYEQVNAYYSTEAACSPKLPSK